MATNKEIRDIIGRIVARNYPNPPVLDDLTVAVWMEDLGDMPSDALQMALRQYASEPHQFGPSAGVLRDIAVKLLTPAQAPAQEGWGLCKQAMHIFGHTKHEQALAWIGERNPVAAKAIQQLGWHDWGMSDTDHEMSWRAQFERVYNAYAQRQREELAQLPAVAEFKQLVAAKLAQEITGGVAKKLAAPGVAKR